MDTKTCSLILIIFYSLLLLQGLQTTEAHRKNLEIIHLPSQEENSLKNSHEHALMNQMEPELNVFFHYNDLKFGNKMKIYFPKKDPSTSPHLLTKQDSDSIPFASLQLPYILKFFSFPKTSKQAKAIKTTLHHCEFPPLIGETKFCATSLESMLDSIKKIFGFDSHFKVLTTNFLNESKLLSPLQNYTIFEPPVEIFAPKIIACHMLPYPYAVFYCHGQASDNLLYKVLLDGEDGGRVEATAMCHMDTSQWDPDHVAFRVLGTRPGSEPVCHFFPADNLVWIPVSN